MLPKFHDACKKQLNLVEGQFMDIASPNHPGNYPGNLNCEITLNAASGMVIYIKFKYFVMEGGNCNNDYLLVS